MGKSKGLSAKVINGITQEDDMGRTEMNKSPEYWFELNTDQLHLENVAI